MSAITTHVLDTSRGRPAVGLPIQLHMKSGEAWELIGEGLTDANGRCNSLMGDRRLETNSYKLTFAVGPYFQEQERDSFYSEITVAFEVRHPETHYHVPLLISPFGYSTYRGS